MQPCILCLSRSCVRFGKPILTPNSRYAHGISLRDGHNGVPPADIRQDYRTASFVANNRVIFNIKGNDYRLVIVAAYRKGRLFVCFVGTHIEYDQIYAEVVVT